MRKAVEINMAKAMGLTLAAGSTQIGRSAADAVAKGLGLTIDWVDAQEALVQLTQVTIAAYADVARKSEGEVVPTPPAPDQVVRGKGPTYRTIRDLFPLWEKKAKPDANAIRRAKNALDLLDESKVPQALAGLTQRHGADFRDWLRDPERAARQSG